MTSVSVYDPGGWSDSFCNVMAIVTWEKILLTDAIFWDKKKFPNLTTRRIKDEINLLNNHFHFDYHLCETNNQGHMIISDLKYEYKIPVIGITTSANLKTSATIRRGTSLDKDKTVPYLMKFIEDGTIELPKILTPGLREGMDQVKNYGVSKSGKYQALSGHDDFISCLIILVHWAKARILKSTAAKLIGAGLGDPYDFTWENKVEQAMKKRFADMGVFPDKINIKYPK